MSSPRLALLGLVAILLTACASGPLVKGPDGQKDITSGFTSNQALASSVPFHRIELTGVSFVDARHGWLAQGSTILATADGGQTWTRLYDTETPYQIHGIQRLSRHKGWYATGEGLFETNDGGQTWTQILNVSFLYGRFQFVEERTGWIRLYPGEMRSTNDGGKNWRPIAYPCGQLGGPFSFVNNTTGWIVCPVGGGAGIENKQLYRTDDGGRTWVLISQTEDGMPLSSYAQDLFFLDAKHGWLTTAKGDLLATTDGGQNWKALPSPGSLTRLRDVQFLSVEQGYLIATVFEEESRLLTTTDGGVTWSELYRVLARPR